MDKEKFEELKLSIQEMKDIEKIPKGMYCYDEKGKCPFWSIKEDLPEQENGYCSFLGKSDYDINREVHDCTMTTHEGGVEKKIEFQTGPDNPGFFSLLWDACKECNYNDYTDEEYEEMCK